jgi:hypothetical protein
VSPWLKTILDKVIMPRYNDYMRQQASASIKRFYAINSLWESVEKTFNKLHITEDNLHKDIFELRL